MEPEPPKPIDNRKIVYDKLKINERSTTSEHGPLDVLELKIAMGWETEKEFQARMVQEKPDSKPEHWLFGDDFHCLNTDGVKVKCWENGNNRPFDMTWCESLIHTQLHGDWAGPLMMPGETVNGETIRIGRYGTVLSGQHSMTAAVLADEWLQKSRAKFGAGAKATDGSVARLEKFGNVPYPAWDGHEHVVLETIVITGLSEDERVLRTIDYVKPRSTADMLYTMPLFRNNTPAARKELTRMLSSALDFLWTRTDTQGYRTHPEVTGFLERHKTILKCVEHIFLKNSVTDTKNGRKISKLHLSVGHASALLYLMGCSGPKTDGDAYRWASPPSEKGLDWSYFDKACDFWTGLAESRDFIPVRTALGKLIVSTTDSDTNQGLGGRNPEKLAILAKAWDVFKDHPMEAGEPFVDDDLAPGGTLCLSYNDLDDKGNKLPDGQIKLLDVADFYGIDSPEVVSKSPKQGANKPTLPPAPTPEEIAKATEEARARRLQK